MDEFFQRLREIQKKERSISGLADVGENFYNDVNNYLNKLIKDIGDNPLSFYSYLHRDARRISAEIFERREHKIINSALLNIQKSHEFFGDNSSKNEVDSPSLPPQNMTSEEENLYYSITKSFLKYRKKLFYPINDFKMDKKEESPKKKFETPKKKVPLGIDHDLASYHAYEIGEEPEDIPLKKEETLNSKKSQIRTLEVLEELPSIMGVDREIYGPLIPQDIVAMPEANAQIIIKNNKGRFIKEHQKIAYK